MTNNNNDIKPKEYGPQDLAGALAICASFNLRKASRAVTQVFDEMLVPVGLRSTQLTILLVLASSGPMAMSRLSRELVLNPSTLSRNLKPLERMGYLELVPAKGRGKLARITEDGANVVQAAVPIWRAAQDQFMAEVGQETWQVLLNNLGFLTETIRGKPDPAE